MAGRDILIHVDDDRFRLCGCPEDDASRRFSVALEIPTPTGPRTKSLEWSAEAVAVALFLLGRGPWSGARARYIRSALGVSMHELAYLLGESDQTAVVARERGEGGFSSDQAAKLRALVASALPLDFRDRVRTMATRSTQGDGERLMFWIG